MGSETKRAVGNDGSTSAVAPVLRVRLAQLQAEREALLRAGLGMVRALRGLRERIRKAGEALPRARTVPEMTSMGLAVTVDAPILAECMEALQAGENIPGASSVGGFSPAEVEAAILIAWPVHASLSPADFAARVRRQLESAPGDALAAQHDWTGPERNRCSRCHVFRHRASRGHPVWPGQTLYSLSGEHWDAKAIPCKSSLLEMGLEVARLSYAEGKVTVEHVNPADVYKPLPAHDWRPGAMGHERCARCHVYRKPRHVHPNAPKAFNYSRDSKTWSPREAECVAPEVRT